jgi:hypothetical protein
MVTAAMAWYTRNVAERTADMATFAKQEVEAIVQQGASIQEQARATAEQVALARASLLAAVQPWLTLGGDGAGSAVAFGTVFYTNGLVPSLLVDESLADHLRVSVTVRNVGSGLAIIDGRSSHFIGWKDPRSGPEEQMEFNWASVAEPVLPPGEQCRVEFDVDLTRWLTDISAITHQDTNNGEFSVDIVYGDVLGQQRSRVRLKAARTPPDTWAVYQLDYFAPPDASSPQPSVRIS